ncbi:hypothetical protein VOLCADRAFT_119665 [Volvox carteri f. nagariensis]|uniref:Uncharacterized protein n=1 Tax=Volvox carteri f. nagariensis TaxID=3068 RepID=D8UFA2_VOLCA|nr:uncharacterized protein VOLCADRAFT_119665 [Volvox carteri f. nagariensis]EFJ41570.1 hypothetical protein VOLCADRAFT_119665 [Volvox carteri f. nagariensis]|eukprot:XP_002957361.1 hypothetical protein VOLCADRAFT_119665 [Volvox carteri f. nagariensis]
MRTTNSKPAQQVARSAPRWTSGAIRIPGPLGAAGHARFTNTRVTASAGGRVGRSVATAASAAADDEYISKRYKAELHMMSSRLGGVVQQAVAAAVLGTAGGRPSSAAAAPPPRPPSTPAAMASAYLRCLEAQLQAKKYMSRDDEAGDVLGSFPSSSLFYYPGGGLQGVVEHLAAAVAEARGAAAPAVASVIRSLAGAVARLAVQPNAEAARGKAAAVITCLDGMAEALQGATKGTSAAAAVGAQTASAAVSLSPSDVEEAAVMVGLEAGQVLREVATVMDCIAGGSPDLPTSHTEGGRAVSPSTPVHPLLSALEVRLYAESTWRPDSAAEIAAGLIDFVAALLAPSRAGNTGAVASTVARGSACAALHNLARALSSLAVTLRGHRVDPTVASRLLDSLGEALAAACITRDATDPTKGPPALSTFGGAQLLVGLARMAAGEALAEAVAPGGAAAAASAGAAAVAADAAAGDASIDRWMAVSDSSLVLDALAAQAQEVAATHREHIAQVLQDLRDVPSSLGNLSELPPLAAAASAAEDLMRRAT